jgi:hypothetical protein
MNSLLGRFFLKALGWLLVLLPALAPVMLWLMLDRRFLPTLLVERELAASVAEERGAAPETRR